MAFLESALSAFAANVAAVFVQQGAVAKAQRKALERVLAECLFALAPDQEMVGDPFKSLDPRAYALIARGLAEADHVIDWAALKPYFEAVELSGMEALIAKLPGEFWGKARLVPELAHLVAAGQREGVHNEVRVSNVYQKDMAESLHYIRRDIGALTSTTAPSVSQPPQAPEPSEAPGLPAVQRMPLLPNPYFVGRDTALDDVGSLLAHDGGAVIGQVAAVAGLGGVGKTQLAVAYAYRHGGRYPGGVFWLHFEKADQVPAEVADCGPALGLFPGDAALSLDEKVRRVRARWDADGPACLLIYDNCEDSALLTAWRPKGRRTHVLVTSRCHTWPAGLACYRLDVLASDAARKLLQDLAPLSDAEADALAEEVGYLPLALHLAGSYLAVYGEVEPFVSYLDALRRDTVAHRSLTAEGEDLPTGHDRHVARTFARGYDRLDPADAVDALARQMLLRAALLAPGEPIPLDLLTGDLVPEETPHVGVDARRRLAALGLVTPGEAGVTLHRLVAAYVLGVTDEGARHAADAAAAWVVHRFANAANNSGLPKQMLPYLAHLRTLADRWFPRADEETARLCNSLGFHLRRVAAYQEAERYVRRSLVVAEGCYGGDHSETAIFCNNLASVLEDTRQFEEAEVLFRRALAIDEAANGKHHPDVATDLNNLAELLWKTARVGEAVALVRRALAIDEAALGPDQPDVARDLNNLALLLRNTDRVSEAEPLYRRALAIDEAALGPDHPNVARDLNNLALLLRKMDRVSEAEPLYRRALAIDEAALGPDHPKVANRLNNLAVLLGARGEREEAVALMRRAGRIWLACLGAEHPWTKGSLEFLAGCGVGLDD